MMQIKVYRGIQKEKARKTESQGREDARITDAEAQGQGNVYQEEGRIISASVDEVMQADIVKEVIIFEKIKILIALFQVPTCRKKKSRSYLEENGCRSRKLLTQKLCAGDCHDGTCCKVIMSNL